jgi:hypothetical protein
MGTDDEGTTMTGRILPFSFRGIGTLRRTMAYAWSQSLQVQAWAWCRASR